MPQRPKPAPVHWIVQVDNSPRSRGAARWGAWLSNRSTRPLRLTALHVGELDELAETHPGVGSPLVRAREATLASLRGIGVQAEYDEVGVVDNDSAIEALLNSTSGAGQRGSILGRNQPADSWALVSLGAVTRNVLRKTDDPVFVVPPDYEPPQVPGPIVVGVAPSADARAASHVAEALAEALDLTVAYVHVIPNVARFVAATPQAPAAYAGVGDLQTTYKQEAREAVERWMSDSGLERPLHIEVGDPTDTLHLTAKRLSATMVVTGSRQMTTVERIFNRSVGSSLAAVSHIPTLVVPPDTTSMDESRAS